LRYFKPVKTHNEFIGRTPLRHICGENYINTNCKLLFNPLPRTDERQY
jgi:hypothetical protein